MTFLRGLLAGVCDPSPGRGQLRTLLGARPAQHRAERAGLPRHGRAQAELVYGHLA